MDSTHTSPPDQAYRAFLRSRWPARARLLALYAAGASPILLWFDWVFTRALAPPPSGGRLAALRLGWLLLPALGWLVQRHRPTWRQLPAVVVGISVAWTWGNDWAFLAIGLGDAVIRYLAMVLCLITAATFLPVRLRGRLGVFVLMALGPLALDASAQPRTGLALRLWTDAALFALAGVVTVIFENFAASQRRGLALRADLERTVAALEVSRQHAADAAAEVGRLAAEVAHEVNNPLSAVKVNVRWLDENGADPGYAAERHEVALETLAAVERIARSVDELRQQAAERQP